MVALDDRKIFYKGWTVMNKFLTESGWKAVEQKFKLKDTTVLQALGAYGKLPEEKYAERRKAIEQVNKTATAFKKSKECAAVGDAVKYLGEVVKAADAEEATINKDAMDKAIEANNAVVAATKAALAAVPPKPDPRMLNVVYQIGVNDGENEEKNERGRFAKAPAFQKQYDEGYRFGTTVAVRIRTDISQGQQETMGPISEEQEKRDQEYTRRRQSRKEFIQYMNEQWSTVLPEDM